MFSPSVLQKMRRPGRHGKRVARIDGAVGRAFHPKRSAAIENVAEFGAGMGVRGDEIAGVDVDQHLQRHHRVAGKLLAVDDRAGKARTRSWRADLGGEDPADRTEHAGGELAS